MAADQALLEIAGLYGQPVMRIYQWSPYCISLGYHQSFESIDLAVCKSKGVDVVRRPTGGRAVFHAQEVTYAVIIPKESVFYRENLTELYTVISQGLAGGLQKLGVKAELQKRNVDLNVHYKKSMSVSCFSAAARNEILVDGKKLVGSAQRHLSWGMLQHGSILTGTAHLDLPVYFCGSDESDKLRLRNIIEAKTVCLDDCLDRPVSIREVSDELKTGMEDELGIEFEESEFESIELKQIESLRDKFDLFHNKIRPNLRETG